MCVNVAFLLQGNIRKAFLGIDIVMAVNQNFR